MKTYPCSLANDGMCRYGGNRNYNWEFAWGCALYCRLVKKWVHTMTVCPERKEAKCTSEE